MRKVGGLQKVDLDTQVFPASRRKHLNASPKFLKKVVGTASSFTYRDKASSSSSCARDFVFLGITCVPRHPICWAGAAGTLPSFGVDDLDATGFIASLRAI